MEFFVLFIKSVLFFTFCLAKGASSPHPEAETTPAAEEEFQKGDVVQVLSDEDRVRKIYRGRLISTFRAMKHTLGKIGIVLSIEVDNDLYVSICGHNFYYPPKAIIKLASAGSGAPKRSSKCVHSNATIILKQSIIANSVNLTCTVPEKDPKLIVRWIKEEKVIYEENSLGRPDIKESFEGSSQIFTLQINDVEPKDKGWYGCELVDRDANEVAISVVSVGARGSSPHPETEMTNETETTKEAETTKERETAVETETTKETETTTETGTTKAAAGVEFAEGDMVKVLSDEDTVKERFGSRIGFTDAMRKTLGKIGRVKSVDAMKDLVVELCGGSWLYSPNTVRKLDLAGRSTLEMSSDLPVRSIIAVGRALNTVFIRPRARPHVATRPMMNHMGRSETLAKMTATDNCDCAESAAVAIISQVVMVWPLSNRADERRFTCKQVNATEGTHVLWLKDGQLISRDLTKHTENPRITVHAGLSSKEISIFIVDVKPEDAGWYTCELRSDDRLLAVAASKSSARRPLSRAIETSTLRTTAAHTAKK